MATGAEFVNFNSKRILGREDFADRFLAYLREKDESFSRTVYRKDGTFDGTLAIAADGTDKIQISGTEEAIDGDGHVLDVAASGYASGLQFENALGIVYDVGLHYAEMPSGIQINPRTGYPEFVKMVEAVGERADPDLVTIAGNGLNIRINSVTEAGVSNAGRSCMVWKKTPGQEATLEADAIEIVTVQYSGGNNYVLTTGQFGQGVSPSTDPADYFVLLLGPTIRRNTSLDGLAGYSYLGTVTGAGAGNPPTTFDTTGQREITATLTSLSEVIRTDSHGFAKIRVKADASDVDEKQIEVQDSTGVPKFYVDEDGDVTIAGNLLVTGTTTQNNVVQVNSNETITGNLTAGDTTSDSHVVKGTWKHSNNAGTANYFFVDGSTGRIGIGQVQDASYQLAVSGGIKVSTGSFLISDGVIYMTHAAPEIRHYETGFAVNAGGLWRTQLNGGDWYVQENTAAGGDFSSSKVWLRCDRATGDIQISADLDVNGTGASAFAGTLDVDGSGFNDFVGPIRTHGSTGLESQSASPRLTLREDGFAANAGGLWRFMLNGTDIYLQENTNASEWASLRQWLWIDRSASEMHFDATLRPAGTRSIGTSGDRWSMGWFTGINVAASTDTTAGTIRYSGGVFQGRNAGGWIDLDKQGQDPGGLDTHVQFNDSNTFNGDSTFTWDNSGKRLSVGSLTLGAPNTFDDVLRIDHNFGALSYSAPMGIYVDLDYTNATGSYGPRGLVVNPRTTATSGTFGTLTGIRSFVEGNGSGGTTSNLRGVDIQCNVDTGHTISSNVYGIYIQDGSSNGTISGSKYGIYIPGVTGAAASNYAIRADGGLAYFTQNYSASTAEVNHFQSDARAYGSNSANFRAAYIHGRNYLNTGAAQTTIEGAYIRAGSSGNVAGSAIRALRILADPGSLGSFSTCVGIEVINGTSTNTTDKYGIFVQNQGGATNNWGIYAAGPKHYFGGNVYASTMFGSGDSTSLCILAGGSSIGDGANIELYGGSHATYANQMYTDADLHSWRESDGNPTYMDLNSSRLRLTRPYMQIENAGDCYLNLHGDTDNVTESHNVWIHMQQDGTAVQGDMGFTGAAGVDPLGAACTGTGTNAFYFGSPTGSAFNWAISANTYAWMDTTRYRYSMRGEFATSVGNARAFYVGSGWADMSSSGGGQGVFAGNCFVRQGDSAFAYSNSHASGLSCGLITNAPAWNNVSIFVQGAVASTANATFTPSYKVTFEQEKSVWLNDYAIMHGSGWTYDDNDWFIQGQQYDSTNSGFLHCYELAPTSSATLPYSEAAIACYNLSSYVGIPVATGNCGIFGAKYNTGAAGHGGYFWNNDSTSATNRAIYARADGTANAKYGVAAYAHNGGANYALYGYGSGGSTNYGLLVGAGAKSWANPHPEDPTKCIVYSTVEAEKDTAFLKGRAQLVNGTVTVVFPDHFKFTASELAEEDVNVIVTPRDASSKGLAVTHSDHESFTVVELAGGTGSYEFDYHVTARRRGYEDGDAIQPNDHYVHGRGMLSDSAEDAQTWYDGHGEGLKRIFKSAGLLKADGKVNEETFAAHGWKVKKPKGAQRKAQRAARAAKRQN